MLKLILSLGRNAGIPHTFDASAAQISLVEEAEMELIVKLDLLNK